MSDIQKYTEPLTLSKRLQYAAQSNILRDHNPDSINDVVKAALIKAKQTSGYNNTEDEDVIFFKTEVITELLANFKGLHFGEIPIVFDLWAKKTYGDWIGFSVSNFITYGIRPYYIDKVRIEGIKPKEQLVPLPPVKWDGTARYNELKAEFEQNGHCEDTGNLVYTWLIDTGKIQKGYGNQFLKEAKEKLVKMQKNLLITELNPSVRQAITKVLREIEAGESSLIITLAKKIAVNYYFKNNQL